MIWDQHKKAFPYGHRLKFYEIARSDSHVCVLFFDESLLTQTVMSEPIQGFLKSEG
jgi:hypothetical protein